MNELSLVTLVAVATSIGSGIGFIIKAVLDYFQTSRDRKDTYFIALLEKRFIVHQQAYAFCKDSMSHLHEPEDKRHNFNIEWQKWYNENCLYLSPRLRSRIYKNMQEFMNYPVLKDAWKNSAQIGDSIEEEKYNNELKVSFNRITNEIFSHIEDEMNHFYKTIEYEGTWPWLVPIRQFFTKKLKYIGLSLLLMIMAGLGSLAAKPVPLLGFDDDGGRVFEVGGDKYVFWGVDADTWACQALDYDFFRRHCEASVHINANCIVIPITWKMFEPRKDEYNLEAIDKFLAITREYGLKAGIIWTSMDYAAGDSSLVPEYLMADRETYTRITGLAKDDLLCPSDPDTLARDRKAYVMLMEHLARTDTERTVMAINLCGEIDYLRALENWSPPEQNVRCSCAECNRLYTPGQDNVEFMTERYALYVKDLIESAAKVYDIPTYTPVCAWWFFPGWRYAENPEALKRIIDRPNHFACPSIAMPLNADKWINEEMVHFTPEAIEGNIIFTDGMDTAHDGRHEGIPNALPHMELAPWYNILWYGGLGAVYWDSPERTILNDEVLRKKFRTAFGPLKAMHYHLARLKSASNDQKFWWQYLETDSAQAMRGFDVRQASSADDYGVILLTGEDELAISGTTLSGPYTVTLTRLGGFAGFAFEKGCFGMTDGQWHKAGDAQVEITGEQAVLTVSEDSGDAEQAAIRVCRKRA